VLFYAYLAIPIQLYLVYIGWYGLFTIFIPVYMFLFLPLRMVLIGETEGFLAAAGTLYWGLMITVYSLSHVAYLLKLPNPGGGTWNDSAPAGVTLVLFLIMCTQLNDVFQYLWGKSIGRRKVAPRVSPGKTWGGLLGGVVTTILLATIVGARMTPLSRGESAIAGLIIGLGGFFGDLTESALKRDLHIKDSGSVLPGHGGILDRVDSLTFTAPLFFHYIRYTHF
jgi:phosphatidate cytidylyltransferase